MLVRHPKTFVIIPSYNEAVTIRELTQAALKIVPDVVVVDDGSTDRIVDQLQRGPVISGRC